MYILPGYSVAHFCDYSMSFQELNRIVNELDICYGGHLRIRSTPLPYAYFVHLRAIIFMYIIALPFALVSFKYSTGGAGISIASQLGVAFASAYAVLGVEQSAIELERPYGVTTSCLAMETFCSHVWRCGSKPIVFGEIGNPKIPKIINIAQNYGDIDQKKYCDHPDGLKAF